MTGAARTGGAPRANASPPHPTRWRLEAMLLCAGLTGLAVLAIPNVASTPAPHPRPYRGPLVRRLTPDAQMLWRQSHPPLLTDGPLSQNGVVAPPAAPNADGRTMTAADAALINAQTPFAATPGPAAAPFHLAGAAADHERALTCLTQAVYYEAGFEPLAGAEAVAQVVLNRLRHPAFPKTVCGVVYDGSQLPTGCQFTFTCDGSLARKPEPWAWKRAEAVADRALGGHVQSQIGDATHYHTQWVDPYWRPFLVKVAQIGAHIFYRWPGAAGMPQAFNARYVGGEQLPGPSLIEASVPLPVSEPAAPSIEAIVNDDPPAPRLEPETPSATRVARDAVALLTGAPPPAAPVAEAQSPAERQAGAADHAPIAASW